MAEAVELDDCRAEIGRDNYPWRRPRASDSGDSGGTMDDVLKRLTAIESSVSEIRTQVGAIAAVIPHLATKSDLGALKGEMSALETRLVKWRIGTVIAGGGLAFSIAKFVH